MGVVPEMGNVYLGDMILPYSNQSPPWNLVYAHCCLRISMMISVMSLEGVSMSLTAILIYVMIIHLNI